MIRLDGTTCLQLWDEYLVTRLNGDPLDVVTWLQACHDAGLDVRVQINESDSPEVTSHEDKVSRMKLPSHPMKE